MWKIGYNQFIFFNIVLLHLWHDDPVCLERIQTTMLGSCPLIWFLCRNDLCTNALKIKRQLPLSFLFSRLSQYYYLSFYLSCI